MGRNVGRHADGDAGRAVDQQIGNLRRQHDRFLERPVVVRHKINRILVDIFQHFAGDLSHTHFCITHGSRGVAVDRAEVSVTVNKRIARGEILGQADCRVIYGTVTMGMILT